MRKIFHSLIKHHILTRPTVSNIQFSQHSLLCYYARFETEDSKQALHAAYEISCSFTSLYWFGGRETEAVKHPHLPLFISLASSQERYIRKIAQPRWFKQRVRPYKKHGRECANTTGYELLTQ